jgi:phosphatidylinositol alpha-mannosyltransferase
VRIALVHSTYWPEVRRGSERLIHDLAAELADRSHEVTILTTHEGSKTVTVEDGATVLRARRAPQVPERLRLEQFLSDAPGTALRLRRGGFDVAQAFSLADGWAALGAARIGGPAFILTIHGIPTPTSLGARRGRSRMLRAIAKRAAAVTVLSEAAASPLREQTEIDPVVLPGGVRLDDFAASAVRSPEPLLFCPASVGDPRKRVQLLVDAMPALRERVPGSRVVITEGRDPMLSRDAISIGEGVEAVNADDTKRLARLYGEAWVTVLPSVDEAFGLVLIESLAAGTPVVAARSGASPAIVDDDSIGRLFAPDDRDDLVGVLESALELSGRPGTAEACRSAAKAHDWARVADAYEAVYRRAAGA